MKTLPIAIALLFHLATSALAEPVTRHLGRQTPTFGTVGQASALLDLIRSVPGQEERWTRKIGQAVKWKICYP